MVAQVRSARPVVVGVGWVLHDSVLLVPEYPREDTKVEALRELEQVGGPVARALSVLGSFGVSTAIGAVVGGDGPGKMCHDSLITRGILANAVRIVNGGRTRRSQVWVSARTASRTVSYSNSGRNRRDTLPPPVVQLLLAYEYLAHEARGLLKDSEND